MPEKASNPSNPIVYLDIKIGREDGELIVVLKDDSRLKKFLNYLS